MIPVAGLYSMKHLHKLLVMVSLAGLSRSIPAADAKPTFFHDKLIASEITRAGSVMMEAGQCARADVLKEQLDRKVCELDMAPPGRKAMGGAELVRKRRPSVLIVGGLYKCNKCTKWHCGNASGVALTRDGVFATCYHVIASTNRQAFVVRTVDGRMAPVVEVMAADKKSDIAICRAADIEFDPVPLSPVTPPAGSPVTVISHPRSSFYTLTSGHVSRHFFKPISKTRAVPFMAITAEFAKGSSGGPVFDEKGNVIGLAASTVSIYYHEGQGKKDNLQMVQRQCAPVEAMRRLIRKAESD